ncbi:MAG: hypothetical protein HS115_11695 [Spirochaetales bacterium]|nr:hypothetical protein [Spirochaetales bacterium]
MKFWQVDKATGLAQAEQALIHGNGQGRIILSDQAALLADVPPATAATQDPASAPPGLYQRAFRVLSAILIDGYFLDLTEEKVLKAALPKFDGVTIFKNHRPDVNDWVGVMKNPRWTDSRGPGIDADFLIDQESNVRIVKGLEIGAINSCSVELRFQCKRSHDDMGWEFYENLGREVDGQVVRWIVTRITRIPEVSLVYAGADPGARVLGLSAPESRPLQGKEINNKPEPEESKLDIEELKEELATLKAAKDAQSAEMQRLSEFEQGEIAAVRAEALRLYQTLRGDKATATLVAAIGQANLSTARAYIEDYQRELDAAHPARCAQCGSTNVSRASAKPDANLPPLKPEAAIDMDAFRVGK